VANHAGLRRAIVLAPVGGDTFVPLEGGGDWTFERTNGAVSGLSSGAGANRRTLARREG
jgi:hypothetical protein